MFEQASRRKIRFESTKGYLSVEDLWDLPLRWLDPIAIGLHHKLKNDNISFVDDDEKTDPIVQLQFDIIKHVIGVRKAEQRAADEARNKAEQKQKILAIIARKQDGELETKSVEELQGLVAGL